MSPSTKQPQQPPCDQCYQRRVRCSNPVGQNCSSCVNLSLRCTRERVRGKRGPKKAKATPKLSRNTRASPSLSEPSPTTGETNISQYHDLHSNEPPTSTASNHIFGPINWNLPNKRFLGRAQIQAANSPSHFMTVSELAEFVLDDRELNAPRRDSHWLQGFRNAIPSRKEAPVNASLEVAHPVPSMPSTNGHDWNETSSLNHNRHHSSISSIPSVPGIESKLDGTALALAVGLPLRLGQEVTRCVDQYFSYPHHVVPILHEESFRKLLAFPSQLTVSQRILFLAFCAVTRLRSVHMVGPVEDREARELGCVFLDQCLRFRADIDAHEATSPYEVITAYFLHVAYACLSKDKSARFYLRVAICLAMDIGVHLKGQPENYNDVGTICAQRTLALLYVIERATAVLDRFDVLIFRDAPFLPDICFDERDRNILAGFRCLLDLFRLLDNEVVQLWCSDIVAHGKSTNQIRDQISTTQSHLSTTWFGDSSLSEFHRADIQVTQQWLRLIFWQMAMRLGLLSNWSEDPVFSYNYPVQVGKDLCSVLQSFSEASIRAHHFSIYNKIFEIAYSMMDILTISGVKDGPGIHELKELFRYLASSPITHLTYVRVLMEKVEQDGSQTDMIDGINSDLI